jgi:hypothetical protein
MLTASEIAVEISVNYVSTKAPWKLLDTAKSLQILRLERGSDTAGSKILQSQRMSKIWLKSAQTDES